MSDTVLIVAAHPDDEVLGCGGTIAWHAAKGDAVHILFFTDGVGARHAGTSSQYQRDTALRNESAQAAAEILGALPPTCLGFPDNRLDRIELLDLIQPVEEAGRQIEPSTIYTHWASDLNIDHRRVYEAVITAFRPISGTSVRIIRSFEVPSSTEWGDKSVGLSFRPTVYVDVSRFLHVRRQAMEAYAQEMRAFPHPRSEAALDALVRWRGAESGLEAAEAFVNIREILP